MHIRIDDNIISFHQGEKTIMYYNVSKNKIILLAVIPTYKTWNPFDNKQYFFYDFINNIEQSDKTLMSYDSMINNVQFILKYVNVKVSQDVQYVMT